jgi:hypothetical protein
LPEQRDHIRTVVERVLPAHRFHDTFAAALDRNRHTVAAEHPPTFVDDQVARFTNVEAFVHRAGELIGLGPQRMAVAEIAELAVFEPLARQLAHLLQESQVAPLSGRLSVGPLEDFDQAVDAAIVSHGGHDEQLPRGVGAHSLVSAAR